MADTLFHKVWNAHTVRTLASGQTQLFIGLHLIHEVTSPQAFEGLRKRGIPVRHPERTVATVDHIVPTTSQARPFADPLAEEMLATLEANCAACHKPFSRDELRAAFNSRTRGIVINSPNNPSGKVFSREELEFIAGLCLKHDAYAVCDEVYEHIIFDERRHLSIMALPGMRRRTARSGASCLRASNTSPATAARCYRSSDTSHARTAFDIRG